MTRASCDLENHLAKVIMKMVAIAKRSITNILVIPSYTSMSSMSLYKSGYNVLRAKNAHPI
jgi:hypothetical protein